VRDFRFNASLLCCRVTGWYFLIAAALTFRGDLAFGHELGDTFFATLLLILTLITHGLPQFFKKRNNPSSVIVPVVATLLVLLALYFTYSFTLGRGTEKPWNGKIFVRLHTEDKMNLDGKVHRVQDEDNRHFRFNV
jgi:hypothetical protein